MIEDVNVSFTTLTAAIFLSVTWAGSIAGVYFALRNRVASGEARMDRFKSELDIGSAKFSRFEEKFTGIEATHRDHGERLVRLETLLGSMDGKLDNILREVRVKERKA
jgi:hypothetical protein